MTRLEVLKLRVLVSPHAAYDSGRRVRMVIGEKLKALRKLKNLSQGDIEQRTGLLRCYISRVENGHTVPSVDTLEKLARALEAPMYRLFTEEAHIKKPNIPAQSIPSRATSTKQDRELRALAKLLGRMNDRSRGLLLHMMSKMANRAYRSRVKSSKTLISPRKFRPSLDSPTRDAAR